MTIQELLNKCDKILSEGTKIELRAQGHYGSGALDHSVEGKVTDDRLEGTANYYAAILNAGYGPGIASMKQFPFVYKFFLSKGHDEEDAKRYAAMTIRKWEKFGMPTGDSSAYSETGQRTNFMAAVRKIMNTEVAQEMSKGLDKIVSDKFNETKSETI